MGDNEEEQENIERLSFEAESLSEIYGDAFSQVTLREWKMVVYDEPLAVLMITIPTGYPSSYAPSVTLTTPLASEDEILTIENGIGSLYNDAEGEVVFEYIEQVREQLSLIIVAAKADALEIEEMYKPTYTVNDRAVAEIMQEEEEHHHPRFENDNANDDGSPQAAEWTFEPDSTRFKQPRRKFNIDGTKLDVEIHHSELIIDRKSKFQAHVAKVKSDDEVQWVHSTLLQDKHIAQAAHNVVYYKYYNEAKKVFAHDNDDDGETGAGSRLAEMMHRMKINNVFVMVTRWYGGIKLGPDRFRHFNNAAKQVLRDCGFDQRVNLNQSSAASSSKSKSNKKK